MPARPAVFVAGPVAWNLLVHLPRLPRPEPHMEFASRSWETLGGTSAGKALNLARLGVPVALRTVVGADENAGHAIGVLTDAGVDVIAEVDPHGSTERHLNLMADDGGRLSLYLSVARLPEPPLHAARAAAALAAADVAIIDLADSARPLLAEAAALAVPIWVDLHDYDGAAEFHTAFAEAASVIFLSSDRMPDPRPFMAARIAAGASLVICTHGRRGATALDAQGRWYDVPAVPVAEVVDTNGAGDAFVSAYLVAAMGGAGVPEALAAAAGWAARCVQSRELAPLR